MLNEQKISLKYSTVCFDSKVGEFVIIKNSNGYVFEFTSGFNNGLHCDVPFESFDKCYTHIKGRMREWIKEMKQN